MLEYEDPRSIGGREGRLKIICRAPIAQRVSVIPSVAALRAARWKTVGSQFGRFFQGRPRQWPPIVSTLTRDPRRDMDA